MNAVVRPGVIHIGVEADLAGRVSSVIIHSTRPSGLARVFRGRRVGEVPPLASQLFSLCGFSHAIAARRAIGAALGDDSLESRQVSAVIGLAAENLSESLRATALGWPRDDAQVALVRIAAPLREAMNAARLLIAAGRGDAFENIAQLALAVDRLSQAAEAFGLRSEIADMPLPGSFFAEIMSQAQAESFIRAQAPDALQPADDAAVVQGLQNGRERYGANPTLPDRIVETGAHASHWRKTTGGGSALAARLGSRFIAMGAALRTMAFALSGAEANLGDSGTEGHLAEREGFAAVETARGRLYHWVRLDRADRVEAYEILAPTEWNFHPAGPFAAMLLGARIGSGAAARLRIGRLAAVFDPCVACQVELRELAHA